MIGLEPPPPKGGLVPSGVLTAGSLDDHLNPKGFDAFLKHAATFAQQGPSIVVRRQIWVEDSNGKPVNDATVTVRAPGDLHDEAIVALGQSLALVVKMSSKRGNEQQAVTWIARLNEKGALDLQSNHIRGNGDLRDPNQVHKGTRKLALEMLRPGKVRGLLGEVENTALTIPESTVGRELSNLRNVAETIGTRSRVLST